MVYRPHKKTGENDLDDLSEDPLGGDGDESSDDETSYQHVCLFTALNALGVHVSPTCSGPFRALAHGNPILRPLNKALQRTSLDLIRDGCYVVWTPELVGPCGSGHFIAVQVIDQRCLIHRDDTITNVSLQLMQMIPEYLWFQLRNLFTAEQRATMESNRVAALSRRRQRLSEESLTANMAVPASLPLESRERWLASRERALRRRLSQLIRPRPPLGWAHPECPPEPEDFYTWNCDLPRVDWLQKLNEHPRDHKLKFEAASHKYCIEGVPTLGSVTGLVHAFCTPFNGPEVIRSMRLGRNWPRPGYLSSSFNDSLIHSLNSLPGADALTSALELLPRDEVALCSAAKAVARHSEDARRLVDNLTMSDAEILQMWDVNRDTAAHHGNFRFLNALCL